MIKKQQLCKALLAACILFSSSALFAQVKIGSNPTVINPANNLEVESTDPTKKVSVDKTTGKVTIADGSQGAAKVLTSDANGVATWQTLRTTAITSFIQSAPGLALSFPYVAGTCAPTLGSPPPACAVDINHNGSFSISNATNDVIIDLINGSAITNNTQTVYYFMSVFIDKTTPGSFEYVGGAFVTYSNIGCGSARADAKVALKNLAVRANYNIKVFYTPWVNFGTTANIGIGTDTSPGSGCGAAGSYDQNKLIVSISQ